MDEPNLPRDTPRGPDPIDPLLRAKAVFLAVRELPIAARDDALAAACSGDEPLRQQVLLLLKGEAVPLPFESLAEEIRAAADGPTRGKLTGSVGPVRGIDFPALEASRFGNYKVLERIGEGGFGIVYMAEQEKPVRRRVALKIIKLGMDTKQVVARFEAERQALALMDHPGIAKVFDGGATETGRPYFVMELVRGLPITEFCDQHTLSIAKRLELMAQVCEALQHAHHRGVIHRDIKPSNVLVSMIDDKPCPKVIDFGIAKATSARLTERTVFTEFRQMIGTPEYMSPEQAGDSAEDVDTRTDVYSAGVLLYELLVGATPFDSKRLRSAAYGEVQRIIREEEPPKPSTRLSKEPVSLSTAATHRATQPTRLPNLIRGELDWIVMKSLEKERTRRYESASAMAADLRRYLAGHAVLAAPPDAMYRARKFVRRHKGPVLAGSLLLAALITGLAGTTTGFVQARLQRDRADAKATEAIQQRERADLKAEEALAAESLATRRAYSANLLSASNSIARVQYNTARAFLEAAPARLRGWEWRTLRARLDSSVRALMTAPPEVSETDPSYVQLAMLPDAKSFLVITNKGTSAATRWDLQTGTLLHTYPQPFNRRPIEFSRSTLSPDRKHVSFYSYLLMPGSTEYTSETWDLSTNQRTSSGRFPKDPASITSSVLVNDASRMLFYEPAGLFVRAWPSGSRLAEQADVPITGADATTSPEGRLIADTAGSNTASVVTVRDTATLETVARLAGHNGLVLTHSFSNDGRFLASVSDDATARIWDLADLHHSSLVLLHPIRVWGVQFSPDGSRVATIARDAAIRIWDRATGALHATYVSDSLVTSPLMFHPDGNTIAGIETDGTIRFWDINAENTAVLRHGPTIVSGVRYLHGNPADIIVTCGWDGGIEVVRDNDTPGILQFWDADSGEPVGVFRGRPGDVVYSMAVSNDGRLAALSILDQPALLYRLKGTKITSPHRNVGRTELIDLTTGKRVASAGSERTHQWAAFDAAHRSVLTVDSEVTVGSGFQLHVRDLPTLAVTRTRSLDPKSYWRFARSPDGTRIAALPTVESEGQADRPRTLLILDIATLDTIHEIDHIAERQMSVVFSQDGKHIATGGSDGVIHVYDAHSGSPLADLRGHSDNVLALAFSPDGSRLASAGLDRSIRLWDTTTYDQVAALAGHEGHINSLSWQSLPSKTHGNATPDARLYSSSGDGTARVWEPLPIRVRVEAREARRASVARVTPMVAHLFDTLREPTKVIHALNSNAELSALDRKTSLQLVIQRGLESPSQASILLDTVPSR